MYVKLPSEVFLSMTSAALAVLFTVVAAPATQVLTTEELDVHPRPDWSRPFVLLNGPWRFDFDPSDVGTKEEWQKKHTFSKTIQVPFPWQSELSGVHDVNYQGAAWYQREFEVPKGLTGRRVFLVFGAVDWLATVWLDGEKIAEHEGGYTPFEVDITDKVRAGRKAVVTVRAFDVTDAETPTGKQTGWYTPSGGIWQTVYVEFRGKSYLKKARITPDIDRNQATFDLDIHADEAGTYTVAIEAIEGARRHTTKQRVTCVKGANTASVVLPIADPALWSPESPTLYETRLSLGVGGRAIDTVQTYFGMRKVSRGVYGNSGHEYILLNNKPVYLRGALHQSFNPKGLYTHPDDAFIQNDYAKAKAFGFNFLRLHIKVEEPRALYWADRLGILLMCDMPNFEKLTPRSQKLWEETLRAAIERDFNHPSIFAWCDFNETWGIGGKDYTREAQEWVRQMYLLTKQLDPTRLAEDNSPCLYDHVVTDINSWHFYIGSFGKAAEHVAKVVESTFAGSPFNYVEGCKQDTAPLINSEYGGVGCNDGDRDISWVFLFLTNLLRKYDKICGYVYTELEDIEWEHNGIMNYDRSEKAFPYPGGITLADLQSPDFPVLDCPPYQCVETGARVSIPVQLSHWSERTGLKVRVFADGVTIDGIPWNTLIPEKTADVVDNPPFRTTPFGAFEFDAPDAAGLVNVVAEVLCEGERCGANYCVIEIRPGKKSKAPWTKPEEYGASFPVEKFYAYGFERPGPPPADKPGKIAGYGAGYIEYRLRLPMRLKADTVAGCRLVAEVGAKAEDERLDWPAKKTLKDYPQTDGKAWPTDVTVTVNGVVLDPVTIENDFGDALGVLSHVADREHGSRGEVLSLSVEGDALAALKTALNEDRVVTIRFEVKGDGQNVGGLSLYGKRMGQYPGDPALVFTLAPEVKKPKSLPKPLRAKK